MNSIIIKEMRVRNYKSLKDFNIVFNSNVVLIGKNNSGKSNILSALMLALSYNSIDKEDVYISNDKSFSYNDTVEIDILIEPEGEEFSEDWGLIFGERIQSYTSGNIDKEYFSFKTILKYDEKARKYTNEKQSINWENSGGDAKIRSMPRRILQSIEYYLFDADRDIVQDINKKASLWSKATSKLDLEDKRPEIEKNLTEINTLIKDSIPAYSTLETNIKNALDNNLKVDISPVPRELDELYKGTDIHIGDERISIKNYGLGTRNRAVFSTIKTNIEANDEDAFKFLLIEEPEAHIHPQAQMRLFNEILSTEAQKIITSHSPYILTQVNLEEIYYVYQNENGTQLINKGLGDSNSLNEIEVRDINRYIKNSRGELFFSSLIVFFEGMTELKALPIYYKEYFKKHHVNDNINFIEVDGQNYAPYIKFCNIFNIDWLILSDNDNNNTRTELTSTLREIFGDDTGHQISSRVYFHDDGDDYEESLLKTKDAIAAIKIAVGDKELEEYKTQMNGQKAKAKYGFDNNTRNYNGNNGDKLALLHMMWEDKVGLSEKIAYAISKLNQEHWPQAIVELFKQIKSILGGSDNGNDTIK